MFRRLLSDGEVVWQNSHDEVVDLSEELVQAEEHSSSRCRIEKKYSRLQIL